MLKIPMCKFETNMKALLRVSGLMTRRYILLNFILINSRCSYKPSFVLIVLIYSTIYIVALAKQQQYKTLTICFLLPCWVYKLSILLQKLVVSYTAFSPLPHSGSLFSVALSLVLLRPLVKWNTVLQQLGLSS